MKKALPVVTIALIVYNEEKKITEALESIFNQDYPREKMEVIVVDDKSTDKTVEIARKFPVKILISGKHDTEYSVRIALDNAHGEFFVSNAGDMRFKSKQWIKKMAKPFMENPDIIFVATRYYRHPKESLTSQFLSLDPLQLDPIYKFLVPTLESTIIERKNGYFITEYSKDKIPPQCAGMYRTSIFKKYYRKKRTWIDIDLLCIFVEKGFTKFAYVPSAGYYHFHVDSFMHLLQKRARNLNQIYLPNIEVRKYKWFNLGKPQDIAKLAFWVILANLFLPLFVVSLFKAAKNKTWLYLLESPIAFILTDFLLIQFLINPAGVKLIVNGFRKSLHLYG